MFDEKYKGVTIQGSIFPDKPVRNNMKISFSKEMINEYIPAIEKVMADVPLGFRLLCIIMANKEGFIKGTRSYRTNNPGNIGNTDDGKNHPIHSLEDGILLQKKYIENIVNGTSKAYPIGKRVIIKPYFSEEIAKNTKSYGLSPWLPGYDFVFTGQLDQFVKIYSTGARAGNSYLSMIVSYYHNFGFTITPQSKIQDIIQLSK